MFSYLWPITLVILSNIVYQICAKSVPEGMNPFASLTVTYVVGAVISCVIFFVSGKNGSLLGEIGKTNWAPIVLGVVIVGLEVGFVYAYRAGWQVSMASIVQSAVLAVALLFVGRLLYKEPLSWTKLVGISACLVGLAFINYK